MRAKHKDFFIFTASTSAFILFLLLIFSALFLRAAHPVIAGYLIGLCLALFDLNIILSWLPFGPLSAVPVFAVSVFMLIFSSTVKGSFAGAYMILFYLAFFASSFYIYRKASLKKRMLEVEAEEAEEGVNMLDSEYKHHILIWRALRNKLKVLKGLKGVVEYISGTLKVEDLTRRIEEESMGLIGKSDNSLFFLVDEEKQELALASSISSQRREAIKGKKGDVFDRWVLKNRKPLIVGDAEGDFRFASGAAGGDRPFKSVISSPVIGKGMLGIIRLESSTADCYDGEDLRLLNIMSNLAALSLENAFLYKRTEELAIRDGLTGLFVRRYFDERLDVEVKRALRMKYALSLLVVDIDHFKRYNDTYGHIVGDMALRAAASIIKKFTKDDDILARWGGEEFCLLLPGKAKDEACGIAEDVRRALEHKRIIVRRAETKLTVSIGVAELPGDSAVKEDLLRKADEHLYAAKRSGRNRVVCSKP